MPGSSDVAPWSSLSTHGGRQHPFWVLRYGKGGSLRSPETLEALVAEATGGAHSDIIVLCHGWNNDFDRATRLYERFLTGYLDLAHTHGSRRAPLLVGLTWPSTALVLPVERGPTIAGHVGDDDVSGLLAAEVDGGDRLRTLASMDGPVGDDGLREMATILSRALSTAGTDEVGVALAATAEELLELVSDSPGTYDESGAFGTVGAGARSSPEPVAAFLGLGSARKLLRVATVRAMKDRAGVVGRGDVSTTLGRLAAAGPPVHLVGHSYGAKVLLSALATGTVEGVRSALLLQPAVSQRCFAANAGQGAAGGYRSCLDRVQHPIATTFSRLDLPLRWLYTWALRRPSDIGEAQPAAPGRSRYSSLGGFGPAGSEDEYVEVPLGDPGVSYVPLPTSRRVLALDGSDGVIRGHGDIHKPETWWVLHHLIDNEPTR